MIGRPPAHELSDADWLRVAHLIPPARPGGRRRGCDPRAVLERILYVLESGVPWRRLPDGPPPWSTTYYYYRLWQREGAWEQICHALGRGSATGRARKTTHAESSAERHPAGRAPGKSPRRSKAGGLSYASHPGLVFIAVRRLTDGRFVDVNEAFLELFGYRRDEVVGRTPSELGILIDGTEGELPVGPVRSLGVRRGMGATVSTEAGRLRHVLTSPEVMELGGEPCIVTVVRDTTGRKPATEGQAQPTGDRTARVEIPVAPHRLERRAHRQARIADLRRRACAGIGLADLLEGAVALIPHRPDPQSSGRSPGWRRGTASVRAGPTAELRASLGEGVYPEDRPLLAMLDGLVGRHGATADYDMRSLRSILDSLAPSIGRMHLEGDLRALSRAALAIGSAKELPARLERILEEALRLVGGFQAQIGLVDPAPGEVEVVAARGDVVIAIGTRVPIGRGLFGSVVATKASLRTGRAQDDARVICPDIVRAEGTRSWMGVPLADSEGVLGVLTLLSHREDAFTDRGEQLLVALAATAAAAVRESLRRLEVERSEAHYRSLYENYGDAIVVADADGRCVSANQAAVDLLGYAHRELDEAAGTMHSPVILRLGSAAVDLKQIKQRGRWDGELELRRKDGSLIFVDATVRMSAASGGPIFITILRDSSGRLAKERVRHRHMMALVGELRDNLTAIRGHLRCMPHLGALGEAGAGTVAGGDRLGKLLDDVLDLVHPVLAQPEWRRSDMDLAAIEAPVQQAPSALSHTSRPSAASKPVWGCRDQDRLGQAPRPPLALTAPHEKTGRPQPRESLIELLTPRQCEIADLISRGMTNRQIADHLILCKGTVDNHVKSILSRLGVARRSQIAAMVVEQRVTPRGRLSCT